MKLRYSLSVIICMVSLASCSSPSTHYHTLLTPAAQITVTKQAVPYAIDLPPIGIPAQLDTDQLVVRQGNSDAVVLENERWLSPLGDEIRSALAIQLVQQLGTQDLSGLVRSEEIPVVRIMVQIRRFETWPKQAVDLDADWSLSAINGEKRVRLLCRSRLTEKATGAYTKIFIAQQKIIAQLARHIADTVKHWSVDNSGGTCF